MTTGSNTNDDVDCDNDDDVYCADLLLPALERGEQDDYFALGLVVNWPVVIHNDDDITGSSIDNDHPQRRRRRQRQPLAEHYESFCRRVQAECFPHLDDQQSIMFLPLESLHITVATLVSATKNVHQVQRNKIIQLWTDVLLRASQHDDWPSSQRSMKLKIKSAQITKTAGILLWDEDSVTGGIAKIRGCIQDSVDGYCHEGGVASTTAQDDERNSKFIFTDYGFRIPDIIHTTFMRYRTPPPCQIGPSESNTILLRQIVGHGDGNEDDNKKSRPSRHPLFEQPKDQNGGDEGAGATARTTNSTTTSTVRIDCVKMVDCKIYLQPQQQNQDYHDPQIQDHNHPDHHQVYLTLPIGSALTS
jgi:hypothetical protein